MTILKKVIPILSLLILFSCEFRMNVDSQPINKLEKHGFQYFFVGYMHGRLECEKSDEKTKYKWAQDARDAYMLNVGFLTLQEANRVLAEITNNWTNE